MTHGPTQYDRVLYPSRPHAQTHPDRLATKGTLLAMESAPVAQCGVLELRCGAGGNLIPMACGLPTSRFVGLDLASRQIEQGQRLVAELSLQNFSLQQRSITDVSEGFGEFDYIIAHGVYSWVPAAVRDKILAICRAHLAPQGIAFVSYNAYPGSHLRDMLRQMMLFHIQGQEDAQVRVQQALALAKLLADAEDTGDLYRRFMKDALQEMLDHDEGHLYHDELAEINCPVYFHQFFNHARQHDLQYLGEADYGEKQDHLCSPELSDALRGLSRILREQYLDFVKCRRFRQTLLCHAHVTLDLNPKPEAMKRFYFSSATRCASEKPDPASKTVEKFRGQLTASIETDFPLAKAALLIMSEIWPQALPFPELLARARSRIGVHSQALDTANEEALALGEILLKIYASGLVELHVHAPQYSRSPSERPMASPLARWQVRHEETVTNLCHTSIVLEDKVGQHLLSLLDGTRNRAALLQELRAFISARQAEAGSDQSRTDLPSDENLAVQLENSLSMMARYALLVA